MYTSLNAPALETEFANLPAPLPDSAFLHADSRKIRAGDVFVACQGEYVDGRDYIAAAIAQGAAFVFWDDDGRFKWREEWRVPNAGVKNLRERAGILAAQMYGGVSGSLNIVGVTGTNGKTSITQWLAQAVDILEQRQACAIMGTVGNGFWGGLREATHTTPDPVSVQTLLRGFVREGASHVAMEVSSHGLHQCRVNGVPFAAAVFTNLTRDHLDYHGSMAEYGDTKARLFYWQGLRHAFINVDDPFGAELLARVRRDRTDTAAYGYGFAENADVRITRFQAAPHGMEVSLRTPWGECDIATRLLGRFNAQNLAACAGVLCAQGYALADAANALAQIRPATGRMDCIAEAGKPLVVVDYAHTPDALEKALSTLREILPAHGKLWCVFGCGGNRDRGKRPLMGAAAAAHSDYPVVTSDNPRMEAPDTIIADILPAVPQPALVEADRRRAIAQAVLQAAPDDIVLIAGKGHETYQDVQGEKQHFSDFEEARAALQKYQTVCLNAYKPVKRWLSVPTQLCLMQQRGMVCDNRPRAEHYLQSIGYYRLSAYAHVFRKWDDNTRTLSDDFEEHTDFNTVLALYLFDKKLRLLAMDALERIESALKSDIAYRLGQYHPLAYRDPQYFDGKFTQKNQKGISIHDEWLQRFETAVQNAKKKDKAFVKHNLDRYGCLPVWAACELWDFGAMSYLFGGLKNADKNRIARKYGLKNGHVLKKWIISLNEIRNIVSHHDRLWNVRINDAAPKMAAGFWQQLDSNRPFFYFCVMKTLLDVLCPNSSWGERFQDLLKEFPKHNAPRLNLTAFGLVAGWQSWDLWRK